MRKLSKEKRGLIIAIAVEVIVAVLAYGIVGRFFPDFAYIYNAIIIFSISAVGITVIVYGNAVRSRYSNVLGFLILLFGVYVAIEIYEGFAVKISAFATLAVAIAAFAAIEENRRTRQDNIERESRDRREKLVDEIGKWLRELVESTLPKSGEFFLDAVDALVKMPKIDNETLQRARAADLGKAEWDALEVGVREAEYYHKIASQINEELSGLIEVVAAKLIGRMQLHVKAASSKVDYVETLWVSVSLQALIIDGDKNLKDLGLSEKDIIIVGFGRNARAIRNSIRNAIDKVIELKASFVLVK